MIQHKLNKGSENQNICKNSNENILGAEHRYFKEIENISQLPYFAYLTKHVIVFNLKSLPRHFYKSVIIEIF